MIQDPTSRILELARRRGVLRPRELESLGLARWRLTRLVNEGRLIRSGRGLYIPANVAPAAEHSVLQASRRVTHGTICLLSALRLHDITTQNPSEVWMAISPAARRPHVDYPPLRIVHFSGPALTEGIEQRPIDGHAVPVYTLEKTIADCFKCRNKIGVDIAVEALRDAWRQHRLDMDHLWRCARICRVSNIIRPYLDSLE